MSEIQPFLAGSTVLTESTALLISSYLKELVKDYPQAKLATFTVGWDGKNVELGVKWE